MGNLNQFSKDNRAAKASRSVSKPKDVIYDPMGQWKYPGQVTKIPSGDITMQGVPYPVYGVDNLGNSQMMLPNMDYTFPGNTVTEYPMAQKGRIVKTKAYGGDPSLPNITGHYPFGGQYTKTHTHMAEGGWLNKYQEGNEVKKDSYWIDLPLNMSVANIFDKDFWKDEYYRALHGSFFRDAVRHPWELETTEQVVKKLKDKDYQKKNNWFTKNIIRSQEGSEVKEDKVKPEVMYRTVDPATGQEMAYKQLPEFTVQYNQGEDRQRSFPTEEYNQRVQELAQDPSKYNVTDYTKYGITEPGVQAEGMADPLNWAAYLAMGRPVMGALGALGEAAFPYTAPVLGALEAPATIAGKEIPWLTANNLMAGYFGSKIPQNIEEGDYLDATLNALPFVAPMIGSAYNLGKSYVPKLGEYVAKQTPTIPGSSKLNLDELRRIYHNSERFLTLEESRFLHKHGHGLRENYYNSNLGNQGIEGYNIFRANNQLPPPPSEIEFMPDGTTRMSYNQQAQPSMPTIINNIDIRRPINGHAPGTPEWNRLNDIIAQNNRRSYLNKPKIPINKSGLTKEEVLAKASAKDKDVVSKMSEDEFSNTVLKPTGEVVPYESQADLMQHFTGNNNVFAMSPKDYADQFNSKIDLLNDIINKNNKSGVKYKAKELTPEGRLIFETPKQTIPNANNPVPQHYLDALNKIDEPDFLYKGFDDKLYFSNMSGSPGFTTKEEAKNWITNKIEEQKGVSIPEGESSWGVRLNPGQWKGNVEDIANTEYFRNIPGLEMSNTTSGVFADRVPRKGTGAYESINEYLKRLDLGRVKPGFNSQTYFSRGAWENFIKSGRGVGFYANPKTVYGTMKSIFPYVGTGYLGYEGLKGAGALQEKKQGGSIGWLDKYQGGGSYMGQDGKVYLDPTVYGSSKNPIAAGRPSDQRTPDLDTAWAYKNSAKASEPVVVRDPDMSLIPKIEARPIKEAVIEPVPLIKKQEAILTKEPVVESSAEKPVVKPTVKPVVKSTTPPVSTKPIVKPVPKKVAPVTKDNSVTSSKPINKTLPIQKPLTPNTPIKDRRQIPKTGVVVDKRTNQLYYFGDKDKGTFPVLTGKNPNLNYNPYGITFLESHPNLRNTPVGYYLIGQQETDKPNIKDMIMLDDIGNIIGGPGSYLDYLNKSYNGKYRDILPINAFGVNAPVAVNVGLHRSYAKNAKNPNDAEFKKRDKLYQCGPNQRWTSYGCINVQDLAYDKLYKAFPKSDTLLVLDSNRPNDLRLLNQAKAKLGQKKYGGTIEWLSKYE